MAEKNTFQNIIFLLLLALSPFVEGMPVAVFFVVLVLAIPLYSRSYQLLEISLLLSTISYYFCGADEQIFSIHSILAGLIFLGYLKSRNINKYNLLLPRLLIIVVFILSYRQSSLSTFNGLMELVYVVLVSIIISLFFKPDYRLMFAKLPNLASIVIAFLCIMLLYSRVSDGQRMSFSIDVNANSFGFCSAIMTTVIATGIIINHKSNKLLFLFGFLGLILTFLSGSRTSMAATLASIILVFLFASDNLKNTIKYALYFGLVGLIALAITPMFGLDDSRFSIASIIESGGSNRTHIWEEIIPYVTDNFLWLGYGPGKAGSTELLTDFVGRVYNSTHNTFVESFAETGLLGLTFFVLIFVRSLVNFWKGAKNNRLFYIPFGMMLCILVASTGESYFNDIITWILIGISTNTKNFNNKIA